LASVHEHWTIEDWKNVILSDETLVILLHLVVIESGELKMSVSFDLVFANDRKEELLNLCSRDAFLIIRKVPLIVGFLKPRRISAIQSRRSRK
jgi:hypothetical protein